MGKISHAKQEPDDGLLSSLTWWKIVVIFGVLMMVLWPIAMVSRFV